MRRQQINSDRLAQLLLSGSEQNDFETASFKLERAAITVSIGDAINSPWGQAALLTIVECGVRMFRGGVYLNGDLKAPTIVGCRRPIPIIRYLYSSGGRVEIAPAHAIHLHIGSENDLKEEKRIQCWADGWLAIVSPQGAKKAPLIGNELSGILAGSLAVSEAFRKIVLDDYRAGICTQSLSPLTPGTPCNEGFSLDRLPSSIWLLGLGNLGQATLWTLGLLPYVDPSAVNLTLQDFDISGVENLDTQVLTNYQWIGEKKARAAAKWAEKLGFTTIISERYFGEESKKDKNDPGLALVGVDNIPTRRFVAKAGFDLVIDAGLGASAPEVFDISIHGFPGSRSGDDAWPDSEQNLAPSLNPGLAKLVEEGRLDSCGAMTIAGQSLGIPSTAIAAAVIQVTQAWRAVIAGEYCDRVDVSLRKVSDSKDHTVKLARVGILPTVKSKSLRTEQALRFG